MVTININGKEINLSKDLFRDILHAFIMSDKYMALDNTGDDIISALIDELTD